MTTVVGLRRPSRDKKPSTGAGPALSSRYPFACHVAEGNCVRIPLGGLLQFVLGTDDYGADGVAGVFGFILEAAQEPTSSEYQLRGALTLRSNGDPHVSQALYIDQI